MAVKSWKPPGDLPPQPHLAALAEATGWPISTLRLWKNEGAIIPEPDGTWSPARIYDVAQNRYQTKCVDVLARARKKAHAQDIVNVDANESPTADPPDSSTATEGGRQVSRGEALTRKHLAQAQKAELDVAEKRRQLVTFDSVIRFVTAIGIQFVEGQQRISEQLAVYLTPDQRRQLDTQLQDNALRMRKFLESYTLDHPK